MFKAKTIRPRTLLIAFMFLLGGDLNADTIDVPLTGTISSFGHESTQYMGETFKALPGVADSIKFFVGPTFDFAGVDFHLLITDISTAGGEIHPTNVLFETGTLNVGFSFLFTPTEFTVDLGHLPLAAGQEYAWILDSFVVPASSFTSTDVGINLAGSYTDGQFISQPLGPFPGGTRSDHFKSMWLVQDSIDLAFTMTFSPPTAVPEPASLLLLLSVLVAGARTLRKTVHAEKIISSWQILE